jgi:2-phospho-L-lactate/phosphoenolpyruvate guanylyltransferase
VQASVHSFDAATGDGSVLLDDGRRVPFDASVFARSGLRLLRTGQRVTVELSGEAGSVEAPSGEAAIVVRRLEIRGVPVS